MSPAFPCPRCGRMLRRRRRPGRLEIRCPRCRYLIFDYPRPCAGMVVVRGGEVLLLRRGEAPRRGCLDIPGGFLEACESIEHAARRELREETGLTVGAVEPLGMWWDRYYLRGFGWFPTMNFYFLARWRSGEAVAADDAAAAEWLPLGAVGRRQARYAWAHMRGVVAALRRAVSRERPAAGARGRPAPAPRTRSTRSASTPRTHVTRARPARPRS